ncbi:MAG: hypothetical protein ACSLEL_04590 [Candidatus Malihini olakiniferum]
MATLTIAYGIAHTLSNCHVYVLCCDVEIIALRQGIDNGHPGVHHDSKSNGRNANSGNGVSERTRRQNLSRRRRGHRSVTTKTPEIGTKKH